MIKGLLSHVTLGKKCPKSPGPSALFQPLIISSRTSLWETDYNAHKSNSTYFSDLDIARMHLITCLMKTGLHRAHFEEPTPENEARYGISAGGGRLGVFLGGVSCHFRREIKPFQAYEIWTRVLTWDRKWVYLVSHIVRKGAVKPPAYSQQPSKKVSRKGGDKVTGTLGGQDEPTVPHPAIFATSIAKYVFKSGRITIPPELVMTHSELLPAKPDEDKAAVPDEVGVQSIASLPDEELLSSERWNGPWTWERVEAERLRGLSIAQHFADLDRLNSEFTADKSEALGEW